MLEISEVLFILSFFCNLMRIFSQKMTEKGSLRKVSLKNRKFS